MIELQDKWMQELHAEALRVSKNIRSAGVTIVSDSEFHVVFTCDFGRKDVTVRIARGNQSFMWSTTTNLNAALQHTSEMQLYADAVKVILALQAFAVGDDNCISQLADAVKCVGGITTEVNGHVLHVSSEVTRCGDVVQVCALKVRSFGGTLFIDPLHPPVPSGLTNKSRALAYASLAEAEELLTKRWRLLQSSDNAWYSGRTSGSFPSINAPMYSLNRVRSCLLATSMPAADVNSFLSVLSAKGECKYSTPQLDSIHIWLDRSRSQPNHS